MPFYKALEQAGLTHYADRISSLGKPALALLAGPLGEGEVGESRIGGAPDLPADFVWPRDTGGEPFAFTLQLRLSDISRFGRFSLPDKGLLSIFAGLDEPATNIAHAIYIFADGEKLARATPPQEEAPNETFAEIAPHRLMLAPFMDYPRWGTSDHNNLTCDMSEDAQDAYNDVFLNALETWDAPQVGKLFGHAAGVGHDPREDAFVVKKHNPKFLYDYKKRATLDLAGARDWAHFLTIDSCRALDLCIWDAGYMQFLIEDAALNAADLSNLYCAVESS